MDLNVKHFFGLLFLLMAGAIFWLKPHKVDVVKKKGVPQVAFIDFQSYEITPNGVEALMHGERALKFADYMHVELPEMKRLTPKGVESVKAKEAFLYDREGIELKERVHLARSDGWEITTDRIYYDLKKKVYTTKGLPFTARYGKSVVEGKSMVYEQKSGKISAESIRAIINEEDRIN
ncbi:LPS export ABC transporter periplasmic protein LptC [Hydrogenimonas cancrithermarum]|uniref:LPS export ABC transporter periplasmic protein LptC n=1 Tax=Hydrogenimonas cancrithermarum TaxID=2993563 RepID=A0ABM8FPY0_9BACT|nr:LPS export ABC transporter periplasmic protein LptC [Hydrogenimonas cancrithermarum]BDY13916.1 hypothetical protein HCR_22280 [Hydrogenimonas cancrithermarum]